MCVFLRSGELAGEKRARYVHPQPLQVTLSVLNPKPKP